MDKGEECDHLQQLFQSKQLLAYVTWLTCRMLLTVCFVVKANALENGNLGLGKRSKQLGHLDNLIGDNSIIRKSITRDNLGFKSALSEKLIDSGIFGGNNGLAVISVAISSNEADKTVPGRRHSD